MASSSQLLSSPTFLKAMVFSLFAILWASREFAYAEHAGITWHYKFDVSTMLHLVYHSLLMLSSPKLRNSRKSDDPTVTILNPLKLLDDSINMNSSFLLLSCDNFIFK